MIRQSTVTAILSLVVGISIGGCGYADTDEVAAPRLPLAAGGGSGGSTPTFSGVVQPILREYCSLCHDASSKTAGVDVSSFATLTERADVIVPGNPDKSLLVILIEGGVMPPPGQPRPLAEEISLVRAWVAAGAKND